jgi:hypothetical protein
MYVKADHSRGREGAGCVCALERGKGSMYHFGRGLEREQ